MCLEKPIKGADLSGEKRGYKIFVKANDKIYPYVYDQDKPFEIGLWNIDQSNRTIRYEERWRKGYKAGYHFFRDKNKAIEQFKKMHTETLEACMKNPIQALSSLNNTWKTHQVELCLFAVTGRDITAYGRQWEGKRCYVAKQIMIYSQVMSLPVMPGIYKGALEQL